MPSLTTPRRLLRSNLVDLLVGPHGIDRYLELLRPEITVRDARARVLDVRRQTPRSVTLVLRPTRCGAALRPVSSSGLAWRSMGSGGPERTPRRLGARSRRPARADHHRASRRAGLAVPPRHDHPRDDPPPRRRPGRVPLPTDRPERLVLISGGSGITPCIAMLRTLCDEGHDGDVRFIHYAPRPASSGKAT